MAQVANRAILDQRNNPRDLWMAAIHHAFHEKTVLLCGDFGNRDHLACDQACGLLDNNMLACTQRLDGKFRVQRMRRGDVNRSYISIRQKSVNSFITFTFFYFICFRKGRLAIRVTTCDSDQFTTLGLG